MTPPSLTLSLNLNNRVYVDNCNIEAEPLLAHCLNGRARHCLRQVVLRIARLLVGPRIGRTLGRD